MLDEKLLCETRLIVNFGTEKYQFIDFLFLSTPVIRFSSPSSSLYFVGDKLSPVKSRLNANLRRVSGNNSVFSYKSQSKP